MNRQIANLAALAEKAVAKQMGSNATGAAKKRRAVRDVLAGLDAVITYPPGIVGTLLEIVDQPIAKAIVVFVEHLVQDEYDHQRGKHK